MEYTRLGDTGLRISRLALGCMHPPGLLRRLAVGNGRPDATQDDYRRHQLRRIRVWRRLVSRARLAGDAQLRAHTTKEITRWSTPGSVTRG